MIRQGDDFSIQLSMEEYASEIKKINISKSRRAMPHDNALPHEVASFRAIAGELIWLGCGALPQASYFGSLLQQKIPKLKVSDILEVNRILSDIRHLRPILTFKRPLGSISSAEVVSFSDASFNVSSSQQYGQTGFVCGIRYRTVDGDATTYHLIDWASVKQKRVSYSSYGAEIIACTDADDRGYHIKTTLQSLAPGDKFTHVLNVDSKGLFDTITTLHESKEYRLRQTVQRIRDSFQAKELDILRWIQGKANIADALTKYSPTSHKLLNCIAFTGLLLLPNHRTFCLDSETWT